MAAGTYNFNSYVPASAKYVVIFSCVGNGTNYMNSIPLVGTNGVSAVCATAQVPNGINSFSGSGWFQITGYIR